LEQCDQGCTAIVFQLGETKYAHKWCYRCLPHIWTAWNCFKLDENWGTCLKDVGGHGSHLNLIIKSDCMKGSHKITSLIKCYSLMFSEENEDILRFQNTRKTCPIRTQNLKDERHQTLLWKNETKMVIAVIDFLNWASTFIIIRG